MSNVSSATPAPQPVASYTPDSSSRPEPPKSSSVPSARRKAIRVLSVHLKSGCSSGDRNDACEAFFEQVPVLEGWIDDRAVEGIRLAIMGDFNRRLTMPNDTVWADWDDGSPANAELALASGNASAKCNPRYSDFIDFIVLDRRASEDLGLSGEITFEGQPLSDHCAVTAGLTLQ